MDAKRASEIMKSEHSREVLYNNEAVWIEGVDAVKELAVVRFVNSQHSRTVSTEELKETGKDMDVPMY